MAVTEVSWRGGEMGSPVRRKRAWGADAQELVQLMMGQLRSQPEVEPELTLDLLGNADPSSSCVTHLSGSPDFDLHLHPDEPLPSGWEKCLDLQTGKLYYVNHASGVSSSEDPRMSLTRQDEIELQKSQPTPHAHEFLGSKRSETLREEMLKASPSSSSGSPHLNSRECFQSLPTGKQLWSVQLDDRHGSGAGSSPGVVEEDFTLELDLNLAAGGFEFPSRRPQEQTVCTMEMIQNALKRTESNSRLTLKRETTRLRHKHSVSSSFSSLTSSTRSEPSGGSPSTSSSSSASSTSSLPGHESRRAPSDPSSTGGCTEAESIVEPAGALVMGACTRCLMYVMLNKTDPRCPRCESKVPVDFSSAAPPCKKRRGGSRR